MNLCEYVRNSCEKVVKQSKHVKINQTDEIADFIISNIEKYQNWSQCHFDANSVELEILLTYIILIDTLNFCFWPNPGFEYDNLAHNIYNSFLQNKSFLDINHLSMINSEEIKQKIFSNINFCLLNERARLIREVFIIIKHKYGSCLNFVNKANQSAVDLVSLIASEFPGFRDQAIYNGEQVFFYKRAQILANDLHIASLDRRIKNSDSKSISFDASIDQLTTFPDYRVPQFLRYKNVLIYDQFLSEKIDKGIEISHGSEEEIEIRASTVVAVERIKESLRKRGKIYNSIDIDMLIWQKGEEIRNSMGLAHKTLSVCY